MNYSAILISVYTRLNHLRRCVDSLRLNEESQFSDLYIVSDAAFSPDDVTKVDLVRAYITQIEGFKTVVAINRKKNLGSYVSVGNAIEQILEQYGKVIFLEDDNVVSLNFLKFMNEGLDCYHDDPSIFSISGYNYPIHIPKDYPYDIYKWQGFSAWGVGLWLDRWSKIDWNNPGFDELMRDGSKKKNLDHVDEHLYRIIVNDLNRGRKTIDVITSYYIIDHNFYSIFPVVSKTRNYGHDGNGEHGGVTDIYANQPLDSGEKFSLVKNIQPNKRITQIMSEYFRIPIKKKIWSRVSAMLPEQPKKWLKAVSKVVGIR